MRKALITGIGGFVGGHLTDHLISQKIAVTGFIHPSHHSHNLDNLKKKANLVECDILNKQLIAKKLSNSFDCIFHLAAFSSPSKSFENSKETLENNILGELNLLEALKKINSKAKILIVGSSDEYGDINHNRLVNEEFPLNPSSPYAVSKVAQDLLGWQYFLNYGLQIVRVRPFNHIGPGQSTAFVVSAFASRIAQLEKKGGGIMRVGNLDAYRDFTDVRDMVRAYLLALEKGKLGEVYNIGLGKLYKISDIFKKLISLSKVKVKEKQDKTLHRSSDTNKITCDYSKFKKKTNWKPSIPIEKTLSDTINYERERLN